MERKTGTLGVFQLKRYKIKKARFRNFVYMPQKNAPLYNEWELSVQRDKDNAKVHKKEFLICNLNIRKVSWIPNTSSPIEKKGEDSNNANANANPSNRNNQNKKKRHPRSAPFFLFPHSPDPKRASSFYLYHPTHHFHFHLHLHTSPPRFPVGHMYHCFNHISPDIYIYTPTTPPPATRTNSKYVLCGRQAVSF